eukprot:TRINITY_DN6431_c0_g1_i1.p1 TRINITY_DN6431_c0_g1~~TRINITY_DN6431_c0_g1_i1.p1  ORF type:complete len:292 (+),score=61.84 TRINITY_DN6431_c0_g1_i1:46-876(+)
MVRQIVWLTGMSGAGKTFTGDYLCKEHGFIHVDGDAAFLSGDPKDQQMVADVHKAFAFWLKNEEEDDKSKWTPYFDSLCKRVLTSALEQPDKNIVITFSNYRKSTRQYCRMSIKESLSAAGDKSSFKYIALTVSPTEFARRQFHRLQKFLATQDWTLEHYWNNIKKHPDGFKDEATCLKALSEDTDTGLVGFEPLDFESFPEDSAIDTSNNHEGVLEFIHNSLSLGPVRKEVFDEDFVKQVADIQFNRLEDSKKALRALQERLSKEKTEAKTQQES